MPNDPNQAGAPTGTGDHGEVWDPTGGPNGTGAWLPAGSARPQVKPRETGAGGYSNADGSPVDGTAQLGGTYDTGGATLGKVRPMGGAGAWGGYTGTMVDDGNGGARWDPNANGRTEAVDRARGLGAAAANQHAYQINYGEADRFAGAGQDDRGFQTDAMNLSRDTAQGRNLQSQALGQRMLQQGVQAQQAGAASTRGGSLAQAAAMRQQASGQGAFMQQGNTQLEAQRAAEMAQGRDAYMQQATGLRASDAQAQSLNQAQAAAQQAQDLATRQLAQQGLMGYESQGQAINKSAQDAALRVDEMNHKIDSAASLRAQRQADRDVQTGGAIAGTGGSLLASGAGAMNQPPPAPTGGTPGGSPGEAKPFDPYSDQVSTSDARAKTRITGLATAALRRGR